MNEMKRTLFIKHLGTERSADLSINGPLFEDSQWFCEWSCEILHPRPKRIYGSDQISALYYCLSFIGAFIREMETRGYGVRHETEGDHGGFDFGK
jgi:hypothetical protein